MKLVSDDLVHVGRRSHIDWHVFGYIVTVREGGDFVDAFRSRQDGVDLEAAFCQTFQQPHSLGDKVLFLWLAARQVLIIRDPGVCRRFNYDWNSRHDGIFRSLSFGEGRK